MTIKFDANKYKIVKQDGSVNRAEVSKLLSDLRNVLQNLVDDQIDTDVATHAALTATHGVSGDIVGTSDAQTLTNKTITSPAISSPTITGTHAGHIWIPNDAMEPTGGAARAGITAGSVVQCNANNEGVLFMVRLPATYNASTATYKLSYVAMSSFGSTDGLSVTNRCSNPADGASYTTSSDGASYACANKTAGNRHEIDITSSFDTYTAGDETNVQLTVVNVAAGAADIGITGLLIEW